MIRHHGPQVTLPHFLRGILATGAGGASILVLGMVGLMVSTRVISAEQLGVFVLAQVLVLFLTEGTSFGIYSALEQFYAGADRADTRLRILSTALILRVTTALLVALALVVLGPSVLPALGLTPTFWMMTLLVCWFLLEAHLRLLFCFHQASFNFRVIGIAEVLSSVLNLVSILVFVLVLGQGIWGIFHAKLLSRAVALTYATLARPLPLGARIDLPLLGRMLKFGFPLYVNYFFSFIVNRADTLVIGWLLGTGGVAFYEAARRIPDSLRQLHDSFRRVYFPYVARASARQDQVAVSALIDRSVRISAFLLIFACLMTLAFDREIMVLLFGEPYAESALPFAILMFAATFIMIESTLGSTLAAIGDSTKPLIINAVRSLLLLLAYVLLIPPFGVAGAATASTLAALAVIPVNIGFLRRRGLTLPAQTYGKPLVLTLGLGLAMVLVAAHGWAMELAVALLFLPAALWWGVIERDEWRAGLAFARQWGGRFRTGKAPSGIKQSIPGTDL